MHIPQMLGWGVTVKQIILKINGFTILYAGNDTHEYSAALCLVDHSLSFQKLTSDFEWLQASV
jgi:hypothetical protein